MVNINSCHGNAVQAGLSFVFAVHSPMASLRFSSSQLYSKATVRNGFNVSVRLYYTLP